MSALCIPARDIQPGDLIDLEGDPYADPDRAHAALEYLYMEAADVEDEGGCIAIYFEGFDCVGFPPEHLLSVVAREET